MSGVRFAFLIAVAFAFSGSAWAMSDPACAKTATELRKGPGKQFPPSWKVAKYMPFLKTEIKGDWVKVQDLDGEIHWARKKDLTSSVSCVVVKNQVAMLRKEPSTSAPTADLRTLDRYTPLKKVETQSEWIHVEDETGRQAWIHESQVWKPVKIQSFDF